MVSAYDKAMVGLNFSGTIIAQLLRVHTAFRPKPVQAI
jgi:hypothetical protein